MVPQRRPTGTEAFSFDDQAPVFDRRAGLPTSAAVEIAQSIVQICQPTRGKTLLELGAGTGQIGADLALGELRYLGLDLSRPMLVEFRSKVPACLAQADDDGPWPIAGQTIDAFFLARSLHLFSTELVAAQVRRVARPGAKLLVGGVLRNEDSVRARMRDQMRSLLAQEGIEGRGRGSAAKRLFRALEDSAVGSETATASAWQVSERPLDSIQSWRGKSGLAGMEVSSSSKQKVLQQLEVWARDQFGDLAHPHVSIERYELAILHL